MLRVFIRQPRCNRRSDAAHFDKVVEQIDPLFQGFLQILAQRQVLGVVADFLHAPPLRLLRGLLCPVLVFIIAILRQKRSKFTRGSMERYIAQPKQRQAKVTGSDLVSSGFQRHNTSVSNQQHQHTRQAAPPAAKVQSHYWKRQLQHLNMEPFKA